MRERKKETRPTDGRRDRLNGDKGWNDVAARQGVPADSRGGRGKGQSLS